MTRLRPEPFARLVKEHHQAVYRAALRVAGDAATAADVAQDVFVRALRGKVRLDQARDERATLCWLAARLAQNALRAGRRRRQHEENAMTRSAPRPTVDPVAAVAAHDLDAAVQQSVAALPDDLRVPLQLHCQDEWTLAAVGDALQLSTSTVHDRVQRGLARLRALLEGRGFALGAVALPDALPDVLRRLPAPVAPAGLEAQLLAAGKASAVVAVEAGRRVVAAGVFVVGVAGAALAANAWAGGEGQPPVEPVEPVEAVASALGETGGRQDPPASEASIERARILPGADADRELREALARLPAPPQARFATFRGTVHDADAWPVAGARVTVVAAGGLKGFDLGSARTNHAGAFEVEFDIGSLQPSAVRVRVVEDSTTLMVTDELALPREDPGAPLALVLPADAGVATDRYEWTVFAHDEAGAPLAGVTLTTRPAPLPEPGRVGGFVDARADTDANGHAVLRGRRLGDKWLFVDGRELGRGYTFARVTIDRGGVNARSVLVPQGRALTVKLGRVDDGPLAWSSVWLQDERLGVAVQPRADGERDGVMTFTGLGDGPYAVYGAAGDCSPAVRRGVVAAGQSVALQLKPLRDLRHVGDHMAEVHGAVCDAATGEELELGSFAVEIERARAGASSFACDRLVPPAPVQRMETMQKHLGFHEGGLEPGRYAVVARVPGYAVAVHEFEVADGDLLTDVRVELRRGATLRGRLVDAAGLPVARRAVRPIGVGAFADRQLDAWATFQRGGRAWREPPTWPCVGDTTDDDGAFEIAGLPPGAELRLFAQCAGGGVGVLPVGALADGEARSGLVLRVSR